MSEIYSLKFDDFTIRYGKCGQGKKQFVMLPGVSLTSVLNNMDAIESAYSMFLKDYTIYVFDQPEQINEKTTFQQLEQQKILALQKVDINNAYVLATSYGGMQALSIASSHPEFFNKLIIASSCCRTDEARLRLIKYWENLCDKNEVRELNLSFYQNLFTPAAYESFKSNIEAVLDIGTKSDCEKFKNILITMHDFDISEKIKNIKCQVLTIGAENDLVLGWQASQEIADAIKCELYIYPGYYHAVYDEAPDYKERINDFFKKGE